MSLAETRQLLGAWLTAVADVVRGVNAAEPLDVQLSRIAEQAGPPGRFRPLRGDAGRPDRSVAAGAGLARPRGGVRRPPQPGARAGPAPRRPGLGHGGCARLPRRRHARGPGHPARARVPVDAAVGAHRGLPGAAGRATRGERGSARRAGGLLAGAAGVRCRRGRAGRAARPARHPGAGDRRAARRPGTHDRRGLGQARGAGVGRGAAPAPDAAPAQRGRAAAARGAARGGPARVDHDRGRRRHRARRRRGNHPRARPPPRPTRPPASGARCGWPWSRCARATRWCRSGTAGPTVGPRGWRRS